MAFKEANKRATQADRAWSPTRWRVLLLLAVFVWLSELEWNRNGRFTIYTAQKAVGPVTQKMAIACGVLEAEKWLKMGKCLGMCFETVKYSRGWFFWGLVDWELVSLRSKLRAKPFTVFTYRLTHLLIHAYPDATRNAPNKDLNVKVFMWLQAYTGEK